MVTSISTPQPQNPDSLGIPAQLGLLLEEYGEIAAIVPVLAGLFVTSRLQLRGAQALLANLAIAAIARQAVVQLKKQVHQSAKTIASANGQALYESSLAYEPFVSGQATASAPNGVATDGSTDDYTDDYTIVHSTFGRLRLRIPRLMGDAGYAKRLEKLLLEDDRVIGVRLNRSAASIAIQYDGTGVSELELGLRLLQILEQADLNPSPALVND